MKEKYPEKMNSILQAIYNRRSVRHFSDDPIDREVLREIIRAGTWAPSGLNNQPWRFALITDENIKKEFEGLTRYWKVIKGARALIGVFIDRDAMYHEVKDHQAMGACIQNILLAAYSLGIGSVWLGEILKSSGEVRELLGLSEQLELMAVVAMGYPAHTEQTSSRIPVEKMIIFDQ